MSFSIEPHSTVFRLSVIAFGFIVLGIATAYIRIVHDHELAYLVWLFDLSADRAFPTWYASILLLAASLLAFAAASGPSGHTPDKDRRSWIFIGVILVFLSADEVAGFHEWTGNHAHLVTQGIRGPFKGIFYYGWVVFGITAVVAVAALLIPFVLRQPRRLRNFLFISGFVFVGGALGIEMVNSFLEYEYPDLELLMMLTTALEESLEFAGVIILIYGLLDHGRSHDASIRLQY